MQMLIVCLRHLRRKQAHVPEQDDQYRDPTYFINFRFCIILKHTKIIHGILFVFIFPEIHEQNFPSSISAQPKHRDNCSIVTGLIHQ